MTAVLSVLLWCITAGCKHTLPSFVARLSALKRVPVPANCMYSVNHSRLLLSAYSAHHDGQET